MTETTAAAVIQITPPANWAYEDRMAARSGHKSAAERLPRLVDRHAHFHPPGYQGARPFCTPRHPRPGRGQTPGADSGPRLRRMGGNASGRIGPFAEPSTNGRCLRKRDMSVRHARLELTYCRPSGPRPWTRKSGEQADLQGRNGRRGLRPMHAFIGAPANHREARDTKTFNGADLIGSPRTSPIVPAGPSAHANRVQRILGRRQRRDQ